MTSEGLTRTARRAAANTRAIIDAAEELILENGSDAMTLEAVVDHQAHEDVPAFRAGLGDGVVVPTVGEGEQQREADHLVIRVDGVWLCGLAPDVRVGKGLEIRCDEPLLLGRD